jgi:hypothetical protein
MKKLFCVVVSDWTGAAGLESPIIFHIKCSASNIAEDAVKEMLEEEYNFLSETIEELDIFSFEVRDTDIIELDELD